MHRANGARKKWREPEIARSKVAHGAGARLVFGFLASRCDDDGGTGAGMCPLLFLHSNEVLRAEKAGGYSWTIEGCHLGPGLVSWLEMAPLAMVGVLYYMQDIFTND